VAFTLAGRMPGAPAGGRERSAPAPGHGSRAAGRRARPPDPRGRTRPPSPRRSCPRRRRSPSASHSPEVAPSTPATTSQPAPGRQRQRHQRREADDGQTGTQHGARQSRLLGQRPGIVQLTEPLGHVAERRRRAELGEPRRHREQRHPDQGPIQPSMQPHHAAQPVTQPPHADRPAPDKPTAMTARSDFVRFPAHEVAARPSWRLRRRPRT
jgi:hypothetical protein